MLLLLWYKRSKIVPITGLLVSLTVKANVFIFCDGTPHDEVSIKNDDTAKRTALKNAGYQVLSWYYKYSLDE